MEESKAFNEYKKFYSSNDREVKDVGISPTLLNGMTDGERQTVEYDVVHRFIDNNDQMCFNFLMYLKYYDGAKVLKSKFDTMEKESIYFMSYAAMLYRMTGDDNYLSYMFVDMDDEKKLSNSLLYLRTVCDKPTAKMVKYLKEIAYNCTNANIRTSAIIALLKCAGVRDIVGNYSEYIGSFRSNDGRYDRVKFIDEQVLPSINKKMG